MATDHKDVIAFSAQESNLHIGCEVIATLPNFKEASDFCKNYRKEKKLPADTY